MHEGWEGSCCFPIGLTGPPEGSMLLILGPTRSTCYCNRPNLWSDAAVPVATRLLDTTRTKQMSATLLLKNKMILMMFGILSFMNVTTGSIESLTRAENKKNEIFVH